MEALHERHYADLIGSPWKLGGSDPKTGIDCWAVTRLVASRRGIEVPDRFDVSDYLTRPVITAEDLSGWSKVPPGQEKPGDVAAYCLEADHVDHVATLLPDGRLLHCHEKSGVVALRPRWHRKHLIGFWRPGHALGSRLTGHDVKAASAIIGDSQSGALVLRLYPGPFERDTFENHVLEWTGDTVASYLPAGIDPDLAVVTVNGGRLSKDACTRFHPKQGALIEVTRRPGITAAAVAGALSIAADGFLAGALAFAVNAIISLGVSFILSKITAPASPAGDKAPVDPSPTFSQAGIRNTIAPGGIIPIVIGTHRVGGQIVASYNSVGGLSAFDSSGNPITPAQATPFDFDQLSDSDYATGGKTTLNILIAVSEGEVDMINGLSGEANGITAAQLQPGQLLINGSEVGEFPTVEVYTRPGTLDQSIIPGFNDTTTAVGIELEVKYGQPWVHTTTAAVEAFAIQLFEPQGHYRYAGQSNPGVAKIKYVSYLFRYRQAGTATWIASYTISRDYVNKAAHSWEIRVDGLPLAIYEVSLERLTYDDDDPYWATQGARTDVSRCEVNAINEIVYLAANYGGRALLAVKAVATDQLQGVPTFTSLVRGKKWWVWDGVDPDAPTFTFKWSDNPGEIFQGLMLNKVFGLGHLVRTEDLDYESIQDWVDYCDEQIGDGRGGTMDRARFDYVIDTGGKAQDTIEKMLSAGRASILPIAGRIGIRVDEARSPSHLFGEGNVRNVKIGHVGIEDRPTRVSVNFANAELDYDLDTISVEDDPVEGQDFLEESIQLLGCTKPARAYRHARYVLNQAQNIGKTLQFEAPVDAVSLQPGDVFWFSHGELSPNHISGRTVSGSIFGTIIDRPVTVAAGTYKLRVMYHHSTNGTLEIVEKSYTFGAPATYAAGSLLPFTWAVAERFSNGYYAFGPSTDYLETYLCVEAPMNGDLVRQVRAVEYDSTTYDDDPGDVPASTDQFFDPRQVPDPVTGLKLTEEARILPSGSLRHIVVAAWSSSWAWEKAAVFVRHVDDGETTIGGSWQFVGEGDGSRFEIDQFGQGDTIEVSVCPIAPAGTRAAADRGTRGSLTIAGKVGPPSDVSGLESFATPEGTLLRWTRVTDPDLAYYDIRAGLYFPSAAQITRAPATADQVNLGGWIAPEGTTTVWVCPVDTSGNYALSPASLAITADNGHVSISGIAQATTWSGTKSNFTAISGDLKSNAGTTTQTYTTTTLTLDEARRAGYLAVRLDMDFRDYGTLTWDECGFPWDSAAARARNWQEDPFSHYPDSAADARTQTWDDCSFAWTSMLALGRTWGGLVDDFFTVTLESKTGLDSTAHTAASYSRHGYRSDDVAVGSAKLTTKIPDGDNYRVVVDNLRMDFCQPTEERQHVTSDSRDLTLDLSHEAVLIDTSESAYTITLPAAADSFRHRYWIKNVGGSGNNLTVDASGSETIDGAASFALGDDEAMVLTSDGSEWKIMAVYGTPT